MSREERRLDIHSCRVLCAMGIPMGLQYSITAIGSITSSPPVNALGSLYVAAVAAGAKLFQLLACPFDAMGATMATYCGQNVGACKLDRLGRGIRSWHGRWGWAGPSWCCAPCWPSPLSVPCSSWTPVRNSWPCWWN